MTQTAERERTKLPIDSFVGMAERVPTQEEVVEMAERWTHDPAERIASQLDELALLYDARTDRTTFYDFAGRNHQFDTFATRDADGGSLEEVYTVHSTYSAAHGHDRSYSVTVLDGEKTAYRLMVEKGELSIQDGHGPVVGESERDVLVTDFLHRSLIATVRTTDRPLEQRLEADLDALVKLEHRMFAGRRKVVTATE